MPSSRGGGGGGEGSEIQLSVRIRPGPTPAVDVTKDGKVVVSPNSESFGYPSHVVLGSDQRVAFEALASILLKRSHEGYDCTLMAYGQTGSGKTHTMFGPPGCLTMASVQRANDDQRDGGGGGGGGGDGVPATWGLFPRAVLTLLRTPGVQSLHASAVEVYHENVFDLMDDRAPLSIGSSAKQVGTRVNGAADIGGSGAHRRAVNGVHPASCTCHGCFREQEKAKLERAAAQLALIAEQRQRFGAHGGVGAKSRSRTDGGAGAGAGGGGEESFATVGESLRPLRDAEDVARFARTVEATRTSKSHLLNDRSSRSHCIVKVHVTRSSSTRFSDSDSDASGPTGGSGSRQTRTTRTKFLFVDLAGSERTRRTGVEGDEQWEARSINGSLSALGRVIKSLGAAAASSARRGGGGGGGAGGGGGGGGVVHVPYRDAALTMLLRDSFGGKSCTSVVINVAGEAGHAEETICSLRFGERMSVVRNAPTVVVVNGDDAADAATEPDTVQSALQLARRELEDMRAHGLGGGFVPGAPKSEVKSLAEGMRKLSETDREIKQLVERIAEVRGGGEGNHATALECRLKNVVAQRDVYRSVVERQQTIKYLWSVPTPGFRRKAAEVKELEGRLTLALAK